MQNPQSQTAPEPKRLDWTTMVVPFLLIIILCLCFLAAPDASKAVLENLRSFLGENFGVGYLAIGLGIFLLSIYIAFPATEPSGSENRMRSRSIPILPGVR